MNKHTGLLFFLANTLCSTVYIHIIVLVYTKTFNEIFYVFQYPHDIVLNIHPRFESRRKGVSHKGLNITGESKARDREFKPQAGPSFMSFIRVCLCKTHQWLKWEVKLISIAPWWIFNIHLLINYTSPQRSGGGILESACLSVCLAVRPSICDLQLCTRFNSRMVGCISLTFFTDIPYTMDLIHVDF